MNISNLTIHGFLAGKQSAIEKVYLAYKNLVYFVVANYVDNQDDCNDLVSECFLKALEHKEEIKDPNKLKSFLCVTAKNLAINFKKKARILPSSDVIEEIYGEEDRSNQLLNAIEPILSNKETIVVYYRIGFSYAWKEIEEETGIPESTARRIYNKALGKLREELK